jgi:hypothetical protein
MVCEEFYDRLCGQYDGYPAWKTPVAALYFDGEKQEDLGDATEIEPVK